MGIIVFPYQLKRQVNKIKRDHYFPAIKQLKGNILEIGFGKGENFKYFNDECIVTAIDKKINSREIPVNTRCKLSIWKSKTEQMPFENDCFNVVVSSFVLCSVESLEKSLDEIHRVLKRGGKLILLEHIKSQNKITQLFQNIFTHIFNIFALDCHLTRDPRQFLLTDKFKIITERVFPNSIEPFLYLETVKQ